MTLYFSQSAGNFLDDQISQITEDAVEISQENYSLFLTARASGKVIIADQNGLPTISDPAPPTLNEIRAAMKCKTWQFKRALTQLDWRDDVEAAVAAADQDTKDMWIGAAEFERLNPMLVAMATLVGKTEEDLDDLFDLAITIT